MLTAIATRVVPVLGRLDVTADETAGLVPGTIVAANHSSLIDPGLVLAALARRDVDRPVVLAAAGLWRIPVLGGRLRAEGHIAVRRGHRQAAESLDRAAEALALGRIVVLYPEGRLPGRRDSADREPEYFRTGVARLALATGAPVVPLGQAGARRITSGSRTKQLAGLCTAPLRRPRMHVHFGAPVRLSGSLAEATAQAHTAVTAAWRTAASLAHGNAR
ncbi:1-acyl-sn-glycerol-3-phosphate acyltransferase [Streptacidiphilus sp. PB12-B1b]|uniref:lysophospholipid acyltransferase family protein n=1 Tax=Streptacidiphilus sp. PB12-B1b TaxID=2705012 RepID=UPI0015F87B38|nr:lysophospholipid acyltransferase family protein [Streptacidiphilus sp. PB12-B1b]QMU76621.1 1-acyl-sn-glycerol-3-phosphate acyltransferase [Streptacidiphilus sp. PB12-B1b]